MAQGRAVSIVVVCLAWAGAAFGGAGPSRDDFVRALMQRSRLIDDVQFQLPVEIYRLYLAERAEASEKAPAAFIIEQGRYGVTLDEKNRPSLRVELSVRVLDPAECREIPVLSAALAWDEVTVNGQASKLAEKDGWLQLMPDKAGVYSIAAAAKLGRTWVDKARIVLAATPSVRTVAKFDAPGKWRVSAGGSARALDGAAEGGTHVELPLVPTRRIDIAWTRPVTLPPRPSRYELSGAIAWNIDAGRQQVAARMNVRILGSATDRLALSVPPGALRCEIAGPDVREMRLSAGSAAVFLRGPVTGQTRLDVSYELPIGAAAVKPLAAPAVADGHWAGGTLVVTDTAGSSELLAGDIRGLREIHASDIPAEARGILAGKPVLAYAITSRDFDTSVEVLDLGEFALRESIADVAHYQVLFRPDGSVMCKIDYEIRNRTRQFLRVHLPAGSRVLSARVNDVPKVLTPVSGESDASLLPLIRSKASVKGLVSFPVQIVVLYRAAALGRRGLAELPLPTIDLPIAYGWCDLYAPAGMKVRQWGGPMRKVEQFSSETAVASLSYGSAELAEGYRQEDRVKTVKAPKPTPALIKTGPAEPPPAPTTPARPGFDVTGAVTLPTTQPARARPQPVASDEPRQNVLLVPDTPPGQPAPARVVQQQTIATTVEVPEGGTLLVGGQSLLAQNYFRAGKAYYDKGDYANAAESLSNVRRMAPGSIEATNAGRLLANIDVVHGEAKAASREEKALGKKVQAEIGGQNLVLEQRQTKLLEQAGEALKSKDLAQAQASYEAAEGLGLKLLAQGASKGEQTVRMSQARKQLDRLDERQKGQVEQLRERYRQLKAGGQVEQALQVGNALQRLSDKKDEKTALRGELEKLAVSSVQQDAIAERADKLDGSDMRWRGEADKSKGPSADLYGSASRFTRWGSDSDKKEAPSPLAEDGTYWAAIRIVDLSSKLNVNAPTERAKATEDITKQVQRAREGLAAADKEGEFNNAEQAARSALDTLQANRSSFGSMEYRTEDARIQALLTQIANRRDKWHRAQAAVQKREIVVRAPDFERPRIELQRAAQPARPRSGVVTRTYDVRDLVIASDGEQTVDDLRRRGRDLERNVRGTLGRVDTNGPDNDIDGDASLGDLKVVDGKLTVTADLGGQRQVGKLLEKLGEIRGPQVELGGNIAGQKAYGLVNINSLDVTKGFGTKVYNGSASGGSVGGTFLDDIVVDFKNGREPHQPTEASKARFEDYVRRNYEWAFSNGRPGEQGRPGGGGGGGGAPILSDIPITNRLFKDREKVIERLAEKLSSNLWQDVAVNSRNINLSAGDVTKLGIEFQRGVNSVNFATVDEAQLRTLRQLEARRGGEGREVAANPRLQETIVGTEALLAGGQRAYVAHAGERGNTIELSGNPIVLSHEKYVLIDAGGFITAVKAGEMQHWTQTVKEEDVGFADVAQELDVPRVGNLVKFEKTLIRPADRLTIRAEYTWKGAVK